MSEQPKKVGYLLINLGTPDSPEVKDVRNYLGEFLMDPHVLDVPWALRALIVNAFILPFRPKDSAEAYSKIWTIEGSPLLVKSQALADKLHERLGAPVALSMRYGKPAIADGLQVLHDSGVTQVCIVPLYPHYADSTITTSVNAAMEQMPDNMQADVITPFYQAPEHTKAWGENIRKHLPKQWDHLLLSYHGLPERHLTKADPTDQHCLKQQDCCSVNSVAHKTCYRHQVMVTSQEIARYLDIEEDRYSVSFQSRLGRIPWLTPYTDHVLEQMPSQGIKHVAVACPAFVVDNLETLEEMGMQGEETFLQAGGESFTLIPCINDDDLWVEGLTSLCLQQAATLD
ncbi:MAG: ferrochelatase [Pseudomonadota bacterium]|nr:ferrochelatase [Pseudomonadota bacterium]